MIQTTLIENQKEALKQEKELIKMLKEYKKLVNKISTQLQGDHHRLGTVDLFKTESPSLIVESRINQKQISNLTNEIDTINYGIAENIRRGI